MSIDRYRSVETARLTLIVLVFCALASGAAQAAPIASEDFESYGDGVELHGLNGGSGWTGAWDVPNAGIRSTATIAGDGLSYSNGSISVDGGSRALQYIPAESNATPEVLTARPFPTQPGTVYMSFLYQQVNTGSNDFTQVGLNNAVESPRISALDRNGNFQLRPEQDFRNNVDTGIASTGAQTHLLVLRADKTGGSGTYNRSRLYVNPDSAAEGANAVSAEDTTTDSGLDLSGSAFAVIRKAFGEPNDTFLFDEMRLGGSFGDVVPGSAATRRFVVTTVDDNGADTYVRNGDNRDTNFGESQIMQVKRIEDPAGEESGFDRKLYSRFDLSSVPFNGVADAELTLTIDDSAGSTDPDREWTFNVYGLNDGHPGEQWVEGDGGGDDSPAGEITWNNAPANDTATNGDVLLDEVFGDAPLGTFTLTGAGTPGDKLTFTSDQLVQFLNQDLLDGDGEDLATLIITRADAQSAGDTVVHQFFSKEGGRGPQLRLTAVPEPASLAMLGLGGLVMLRRQRRRRGA